MKKRIKGTPFWGEIVGNGGTAENPLIAVELENGSIQFHREYELTDLTILESAENFMWSVFAKNGSVKNRLIYSGILIFLGFILGLFMLN